KTRTRELFQSSIISRPGGVSMHEHAAAASLTESDREQSSHKRALQLGVPSFAGGLVQGACALLMATNAGKALLGLATTTVAARISFIHSDPIRIPLMVLSALRAPLLLYILCNGWRLVTSPAAGWRR